MACSCLVLVRVHLAVGVLGNDGRVIGADQAPLVQSLDDLVVVLGGGLVWIRGDVDERVIRFGHCIPLLAFTRGWLGPHVGSLLSQRRPSRSGVHAVTASLPRPSPLDSSLLDDGNTCWRCILVGREKRTRYPTGVAGVRAAPSAVRRAEGG